MANCSKSTRCNDEGIEIGEGEFRVARREGCTEGPRTGKLCALKTFTTGDVYEDFFTADIKAVDKAIDVVKDYQRAVAGPQLTVNDPEVWTYELSRRTVLVEPYLENFQKFNSNTDKAAYEHAASQARSHVSHHQSSGRIVVSL